jgi:hypothetical protein
MEARISGLVDKGRCSRKINEDEKRMKNYEQNMQELWNSMKRPNLQT